MKNLHIINKYKKYNIIEIHVMNPNRLYSSTTYVFHGRVLASFIQLLFIIFFSWLFTPATIH